MDNRAALFIFYATFALLIAQIRSTLLSLRPSASAFLDIFSPGSYAIVRVVEDASSYKAYTE